MATNNFVRSQPAGNGIEKVFWETLTATNVDGQACIPSATAPAIASVQFTGTFGGTVVLQGSNDGTNYFTLKDMAGNDISTTAAAGFDFSVGCLQIRPLAAAGVSDVDCTVIFRG